MDITLISTEMDLWAPGLRSISAVLKANGHCTRLVFMSTKTRLFPKATLEDLASLTSHTDLVGVSCLAQGSEKAKQVIEFLHSQNKLIVWGGVHPSLNPANCAEFADIVCIGEGEGMMIDLLDRMVQGKDWKDIRNIAFKENGALKLNSLRPPISDLDELPFPDFTFDNEYHLSINGFGKVSTISELEDSGQIIFNSSRGCAFHCTYCCNSKLRGLYSGGGHYIRRMSVPKLIEHVNRLKEIFPSGKYIFFIDEDFTLRPLNELIQLAEEFPSKVGLPFECLAHAARVTQPKMEMLVKAGLFRIKMGIESGSERTKKEIYDRHVSNQVVKYAADIFSQYPKVVSTYFIIIANPYEERDDLIATARFIESLPGDFFIQTYNLIFFPGSILYERAVKDGLIEGEQDSGYELDFLGGLNYKTHPWKKKNMYLNGLIFLMEGTCTRYRLGSMPRFMLKVFLLPRLIEFNERYTILVKALISGKFIFLSIRHIAGRLLRKLIGDPTIVYNLGYYLRKKLLTGIDLF